MTQNNNPNDNSMDSNDDNLFEIDQEEARIEHANRFTMGGKRLNGRRQLGQLLEREIQTVVGKQGFMTMDIITQWQQIVGRNLYEVAKPIKIKFARNGRSNGVLVIKTLSSAHALTISYQEDSILERVNSFFGYKALNKIQIVHGSMNMEQSPSPKDPNDPDNGRLKQEKHTFHMQQMKKSKKLENIKDNRIKNALIDLYASIKSRK